MSGKELRKVSKSKMQLTGVRVGCIFFCFVFCVLFSIFLFSYLVIFFVSSGRIPGFSLSGVVVFMKINAYLIF